jgi:predicted transposase YbfD/YdcC
VLNLCRSSDSHEGGRHGRRYGGKIAYPLDEILLLCLLAVLAGAECFTEIALFGTKKLALLRRFRPFKDGTPARDHLGDNLATLDAEQIQGCLAAWVAAVTGVPEGVVAIDGKTSRRSGRKGASIDPIHMVSAFAARQRLVLAQVKVAEKSNEIIAIPKLLDMLAIEGAILTIDAMGCQRDIAQRVIDKKADYVLALKGNQGSLRDDAELFVTEQKASGFVDTEISRDTTVVMATMAASRPEPRPSSTTSSGSSNAIVGRASKAWSSSRAAAKSAEKSSVKHATISLRCR